VSVNTTNNESAAERNVKIGWLKQWARAVAILIIIVSTNVVKNVNYTIVNTIYLKKYYYSSLLQLKLPLYSNYLHVELL